MKFLVVASAFLMITVFAATPSLASAHHQSVTYWYLGSFGKAFFPEGIITDLPSIIEAANFKFTSFGPHDILTFYIWVESYGAHVPVASVTDEPTGKCEALLEAGFSPVNPDYDAYTVADEKLEVWRADRTVFASLPEGVGPIPPLYIEFAGYGPMIPLKETRELPYYTVHTRYIKSFATVEAAFLAYIGIPVFITATGPPI